VTDFRKGFDGLIGLVREYFRREGTDGDVFNFDNVAAMPSICSSGYTTVWRST